MLTACPAFVWKLNHPDADHPAMNIQCRHWNLNKPIALLDSLVQGQDQFIIEQGLARLETRIHSGTARLFEKQNSELFDITLTLDAQLDVFQSAITVCQLAGVTVDRHRDLQPWLGRQCERFACLLDLLAAQFSHDQARHTGRNTSLDHWLSTMHRSLLPKTLQQRYRLIGEHYRIHGESDCASQLATRATIDPGRLALLQQLGNNRLAETDTHFTRQHQHESQRYFKDLVAKSGNVALDLEQLRVIEEQPFAGYTCSLENALTLIRDAFGERDPLYGKEVDDLINEGRLRLTDNAEHPDLCLDTSVGSYVQVHFDGSLLTLVRLAHELGHAVHQRQHRISSNAHIPLTDLESETWALYFENCLLYWLKRNRIVHEQSALALQRYQLIEMNHRHRMLHQFEWSLHRPDIASESDIDTLWLQCNRHFYGDTVRLNDSFASAWQAVHHLFTAPFYLMVYGVAKEEADRMARPLPTNGFCP